MGDVCPIACWDIPPRPEADTCPGTRDRPPPPGPEADTPPRALHAGRYRQQVGSTHPTGMHTCFTCVWLWFCSGTSPHMTITHDALDLTVPGTSCLPPLDIGHHYTWTPHTTGTDTWWSRHETLFKLVHLRTTLSGTDIWWLLKYVSLARGRYVSYWNTFLLHTIFGWKLLSVTHCSADPRDPQRFCWASDFKISASQIVTVADITVGVMFNTCIQKDSKMSNAFSLR